MYLFLLFYDTVSVGPVVYVKVLAGMNWKPIVISRAGSCPADDAIC